MADDSLERLEIDWLSGINLPNSDPGRPADLTPWGVDGCATLPPEELLEFELEVISTPSRHF